MSISSDTSNETNVQGILIPGHKYSVKIAENREEVEAALKLRFNVFNIELGEGLDASYQNMMDEDEFDEHCDHLVVIDNSTKDIIGTYRMQDNRMASEGKGFYTLSEFDLNHFPDHILSNVLELGRACIHIEHRSGRVLYLLWRGLAKYLMLKRKRFLFGCCSITSQNPAEGKAVFEYLKNNGYCHQDFDLPVQPAYECIELAENHLFEGSVKLPQLFRLYLDLGAKVCSSPAIDTTFKTIDFLILLDLESLSEQSKTLFLK